MRLNRLTQLRDVAEASMVNVFFRLVTEPAFDRFSHVRDVGMTCRGTRGCRRSQDGTRGGLGGPSWSTIRCRSSWGGVSVSIVMRTR